jgi:uncharacterized SAM-binding protein YcdF (DUF218 family)
MSLRISYFEPAFPLLLILAAAGLASAWRHYLKGRPRLLITMGVAGMFLISMNAAAWLFSRPLEVGYSTDPVLPGSAGAIVILSGTVHRPSVNRPYALAAEDTYERLQHGIWLFQHWKPLPILVCGGVLEAQEPFAATMKRILEMEGVPPGSIWLEDRSRSTHENAENGTRILREHGVSRIVLVVEATSMPRAAASFRKAGVEVIPAPIRFTGLNYDLTDLVPNWRAIALNEETLHEYVGILWYRIHGWI